MSSRFTITALIVSLCLIGGVAPTRSEEPKELPKSGSLSVSTSGNRAGVSAPGGWGDEDGLGAGGSPISGSVSRTNPGTWQLFVQNSSEDTYSVNLEVIQRDDRGSRVKGDSYSYTLKPGAKQSRSIVSASTATTAELNLRNWRNLSKKKADANSEKPAPLPTTVRSTGSRASSS